MRLIGRQAAILVDPFSELHPQFDRPEVVRVGCLSRIAISGHIGTSASVPTRVTGGAMLSRSGRMTRAVRLREEIQAVLR